MSDAIHWFRRKYVGNNKSSQIEQEVGFNSNFVLADIFELMSFDDLPEFSRVSSLKELLEMMDKKDWEYMIF